MKPTITHFASCLALAAALVIALASCSKDEATDERLPDGKYPMIFTAAVEGLTVEKTTTRATTDGTWTGNEEVAMQIDGLVKKYTAAVGGTLSAATGVEPWYWQSTTDRKTVSAWHPYSATQPTSFGVQADQSGDGYQSSDLIYAAPTEIAYGSNEQITFKHLPAKVVVNLKAGNGITTADAQSATVSIINQNLTSGAVAADGSVTKQPSAGHTSSITPRVLAAAATGYQQSVEAIVVPQTIAAGTRLLQIGIGTGRFYYTPTAEQSIGAGEQCTYQITVNATGLAVTTQISDWTNTEVVGNAEMLGPKDPKEAAIGDFYMNDGTIWSKDEYLTTEQKAACVGIVFWVGDPTSDDPLLKKDSPACTHGLVVALHDARLSSTGVAAKMQWSNSEVDVSAWTNHIDRGENKVDITVHDKLQGYANTVALKDYNAQHNADLQVLPIAAMEQYQADYPAPASSSGWYVPSIMEFKNVCWGQGNSQSTAGRDLLNGQLNKVGGTEFDGSEFYWSSSEFTGYSGSAWSMYFSNGDVANSSKRNGKFWVRALLAF